MCSFTPLQKNSRSAAGCIGERRQVKPDNAEQTSGQGMRRDCTPAVCNDEDTVQPASSCESLRKRNAGC